MTTRYRVRGKLDQTATVSNQAEWQSCSQSSFAQIATQPLYAVGDILTMSDVVVPNFHKRRLQGEVFFNHLVKNQIRASRTGGTGVQRRQTNMPINCSGINRYTGYRDVGNQVENLYSVVKTGALCGYLPALVSVVSSNDINSGVVEAQTRALNERGRTDANLWETFAELDKALGSLTGIFSDTYRTMRSRNLRGFVKNASRGYLGWRYGIKPMLSDVNAVIEGLKLKTGSSRQTSRGKVLIQNVQNKTLTYSGSGYVVNMLEQAAHTVSIRAMSLDDVDLSMLNNIGFTTKGLVTLPWELVNKSFVLDWFLNVGDFIGSISPSPGWRQLGSATTIQEDWVLSISAVGTSAAANFSIEVPCSGGYTVHQTIKNRFPGPFTPGIAVKSDFRFDKVTRCLDALSLLAVHLLGNKR